MSFSAAPAAQAHADLQPSAKLGNEAQASDPGVVDTTAPEITVDVPEHTNDNTPTITGTTDAPEGSVVTVVVTDSAGNTQTVTTQVKEDGTYSVEVCTEKMYIKCGFVTILTLYTTNFIGPLSYQTFSFLKLLALS